MDGTVVRIVACRAVGKLHHLQRAEADRAGILQALERGRGGGGDEIAPDQRAAGDDLAGVVIHVLVRERHAVQRPPEAAFGERNIRFVRGFQRCFSLDRHKGVETGLPLCNAMQTVARHLTRGQALCGDRICDLRQRHQGGIEAHWLASKACASKKLAGSRSKGNVPETAAKPSKAGPMEWTMRSATSVSTGAPATSVTDFISFALGLVM